MIRQHGVRRAIARLRWQRLTPASAWQGRLAVAVAILLGSTGTAFAQLDPLLLMKTSPPNVLLVVDTANRMQRDANNDYYDQFIYSTTGANWEAPLGVTAPSTQYRRKYINLRHLDTSIQSDKFATNTILTIGNVSAGSGVCGSQVPSSFAAFDSCTRMAIARNALVRAIQLNQNVARFGLLKMRQSNPAVGTPQPAGSQNGNEYPVKNDDPNQQTPTDYQAGKWRIMRPTIGTTNITAPPSTPIYACGSSNSTIISYLQKSPDQGGLIPAGQDAASYGGFSPYLDAPVKYMLDDAKTAATTLIAADTAYRNTVVVLVVGGGEGATGLDPAAAATAFKTIGTPARRVPIYVIAIAPLDGSSAQLQAIATNSGGQYFEITPAMINAVSPGAPVPEFVRAVNTAVQHTFASFADLNTAPSASLPYGPSTEYQTTSPIIGSVNLANSVDINGGTLPNTVIYKGTNLIPQRSNVLATTGVAVPGDISTPGFPGRLRAFRIYRPEPDNTKTSGYKFVGDGTALWIARPPTSAEGPRNIYTVLPDGTMLAFTTDNAAALAPYLNDKDASGAVSSARAADLITYIRSLPLGGFIDSTPAFLDAPSLDPPPDAEYPAFVELCKNRRTLIFIGGNDGMMHAIDGRTGVEVWAFIPFNLLPKLRALRSGEPVGAFDPSNNPVTYKDGVTRIAEGFRYFVDGSAKLADVKVGGAWRTYMVFGEGPGGTFYQTLDVTMADLGATVAPDSSDVSSLLGYFHSASVIPFKWSFPSYGHFNYTAMPSADYTVPSTSYTVTPYGDLDKSAATAIERSVGQTWSDPAVGQVKNSSGSWVTLVGSGFLPYSQQHQPNRADAAGGTSFYVLDMATGAVLDSKNVGNDGTAETVDSCWLAPTSNCTNQKNALQSDPVATGPPNSRFVDTVYIGDLDGRLWRFTLGLTGGNVATISAGPVKLYDAGSSQPLFSSMAVVNVGGTQQYVFFGSGSDLLPSTGVNQSYKLLGVLDQNGTGTAATEFPLTLTKVDGAGDDEKVSAYPAVAGDIVFFTTTSFKGAAPWQAPDANVYALTFRGGPAYDNTGDDRVTSADTPKVVSLAGAGRATAPFVADQHLVLAIGGKVELLGDPQDFNNGVGQMGVRILSWREIR